MSYSPTPAPGPASSAGSTPVVVASDSLVNTDLDTANQIDELTTALRGLASVRGIAADLRVTVINTPATTISSGTVTTVTTVSALANLNNLGSGTSGTGLHAASTAIPSLSNIAYTGSFSANITRP